MKRDDLIPLFFCLMTCFFSWSQEYDFHHITTVDGLSHNEVRKIVKDSKGFLWFGTQNGLNRFDGYRFKIYKHVPNDSSTIVGDKIFSMVASENRLWVGTVTGLSVINTNTLEVVPSYKLQQSIGPKEVLQLFHDGADKLWLSTNNSNFIIDTETFESAPILKGYSIACMAKGFGNTYWIGTDKGLLLYDYVKSLTIKTYEIGNFSGYGLDEIYTNSHGEVWLSLGDRIFRYESKRDRFVQEHVSKSVNAIAESSDKSIFFASYGGGLLKYDRAAEDFVQFSADPENHFSLSSSDVYDVYVDKEDIVWVGTQEGLDYYDFSRHNFKSLIHLPNNENSLRSSFVQTIYEDIEGTFWVGTREGIDLVNFKKGYTDPDIRRFEINNKVFQELNGAYVSCIYSDSKNRMWIATMGNGLFLYQSEKKVALQFKTDESDSKSIASNSIRSIMEDRQGRLWFGTSGGLSLLKEQDGKDYSFENLGYSKFNTGSLALNDIYTVIQDSKDRIWVGMNKGGLALLQEQGEGKSFLRFANIPNDPKSLSNNDLFIIHEDSEGRIWFGTSGGGLNLLMEDGRQTNNKGYYFKRYTELDGLSDNEVNAILEDGDKNLWIATNKGLSKFNPEKEIFTNYTTYDGVLKGKFRKNARWKTKDGTLFFGGTAGINFFNPDAFGNNAIAPEPVFTNLSIDGKKIRVGEKLDGSVVMSEPLRAGSKLTLPANDNRFDVEFASLSYTSPYRSQYAYRIEGVDSDWNIISGKNPHASYSNIPGGEYRFYLKTSNDDGIWSEQPIHFDITVKSIFFNGKRLKWAMVLLLVATIVLGALLVVKFKKSPRLRQLNQKIRKSVRSADPETDKENLEEVARLDRLMKAEELYLDAELGLNQLAEKLGVSANHLSMLLNEYIGKNFYDYINTFRVAEVKRRLKDPAYKKQTISSIGGDCGFNSKSAFNRIFKNFTGQTPSQYQKMP
ncbi:two-component regulator propeller domain-containing protein [uncultured Kriegella sp.]|uniref:two-component regulator propeller domain-containing protein n=1 Tax=uncultured Kriegella sp. TaxID=1798910 RepID=UPI0030DBBED4|tara:strand:+ start:79707 stop:82583 length:2877 start_codon:yes stop_codon:yes gene_type:complete